MMPGLIRLNSNPVARLLQVNRAIDEVENDRVHCRARVAPSCYSSSMCYAKHRS
jgi:hypothetical protein